MTKTRANFVYYILAVVCTTAFFVHEFVPKNTEAYLNAISNHANEKQKRTIALENLKNSTKGSDFYKEYKKYSKKTDEAWSDYLITEQEEFFMGFDNFKQFMGEFGWAFGLLLYSLFNLFTTFIKNGKTKYGEIILHSTLNFISLYFVSWALQQARPDYSKSTYIVYSMLMAISIIWGTSKLVKYKNQHIKSLLLNIRDLIGFMFKNTKEESEDKMWDVLKKVDHER